jgi:hypothetical protein
MALKHENNGKCEKCLEIINRYPNPHAELVSWFKEFQVTHPEAHVSCAGRGRDDQEALYLRKASKARWGESAHNYNAALDLFETGGADVKDIYEPKWFKEVLKPALPYWVKWYGEPGSKFFELPHIEVADWRELRMKGQIGLVEHEIEKAG